ncbi:MAG: SAM-dependent methyltransferase [Candidatus Midichloria mitochondrii]|uniref:Uncharacterized protein n=1 Tax=Midichloria mitochondrii (strain IricVA) TaxID=696127 RepID=F7XVI5_MIDMI|nr:hypothetical protein midi_00374 [Candidatus Midichloria mitochondrii IricVA]
MKVFLCVGLNSFLTLWLAFLLFVICYFGIIAYPFKGTVVLKPRCGIGSQLFQFAASYSLAKKTNSELYIIEGAKEDEHILDPLDRSYALDYFSVEDKVY